MKVPDGKTLYYGRKKLKAGDEIPQALESKFSHIFDKKKSVSRNQVSEMKAETEK